MNIILKNKIEYIKKNEWATDEKIIEDLVKEGYKKEDIQLALSMDTTKSSGRKSSDKHKIFSFENFLIGLLGFTVGFFYSYLAGGDNIGFTFYSLVVLSIICTAGISLIVWIPALMVLGAVIKGFWQLLMSFRTSKYLPEEKSVQNIDDSLVKLKITNRELSVIQYIVNCRGTGTMGDEVIYANLKNAGWKDADIENAFKLSANKI